MQTYLILQGLTWLASNSVTFSLVVDTTCFKYKLTLLCPSRSDENCLLMVIIANNSRPPHISGAPLIFKVLSFDHSPYVFTSAMFKYGYLGGQVLPYLSSKNRSNV